MSGPPCPKPEPRKRKTYRLPSMSRKRAKRAREYQAAKRFVAERSGGRCELAIRGVCTGRATDPHHLRGRSGVLLADVENIVAVCRACHRYLGDNPAEAYANGWLVRRIGEP